MTALAESVQEILRLQAKMPEKNVSTDTIRISAVETAYNQLRAKIGGLALNGPLPPQQSEAWIAQARQHYTSNTLNNLKRKDLKNIAQCLYHGEQALATDQGFLEAFLRACGGQLKRSLCSVLIWVYLYNYEEGKQGILWLGKWLSGKVMEWDWPWAELQTDHKLFGNPDAPANIAWKIIEDDKPVSVSLEKYGLKNVLSLSGMASASFHKAFVTYAHAIESAYPDDIILHLTRIIEWATIGQIGFSYPRLKKHYIESLLLPWRDKSPPAEIKTKTQSMLIESFGDPRLRNADWINIDDSAMRLIRSWLVDRSLKQFLDIVDTIAREAHWEYRRAFWRAYYDAGHIDDAWVAFAREGIDQAKSLAERNKDDSWLSCAELQGGLSKHAVLLLRIGDLTVADYSHDGKWRIWTRNAPTTPFLHQRSYHHTNDFLNSVPSMEGKHSGSLQGRWQEKVSDAIYRYAGISMKPTQYMPRRWT